MVMLFFSQLYPVALVTDQNQTIPAVPAAGLTQTPYSCEGNAAEVASPLKQNYSHQCMQQLSLVQVNMSYNNFMYPQIQLVLTKQNQINK